MGKHLPFGEVDELVLIRTEELEVDVVESGIPIRLDTVNVRLRVGTGNGTLRDVLFGV
ncbi:hypothetical protein [Halopelagius longus]|uniref:hypothetical protein n=1 Tax=Halopelagius longus TaxID=1236180 RepID=UPI001587014E|nr:hypothetical protein [Halopelagius longus]